MPKRDTQTLDLFGTPEAPANPIEARFWEFHAANPDVYKQFMWFTAQLVFAGHERHSADAVLHRIRWDVALSTTDSQWKINDHYSAYYARLWMREHPTHDGFFRTRRLQNGPASDTLKMETAA